nr:hypothetical protein [candidate division Zixibacteria bacterium]
MKIIFLKIVLLVLIMTVSCGDDGTGSEGTVIWPLTVGYRWVGTMNEYDPYGVLVNSYQYEFHVRNTNTISNKTWYVLETVALDDTVTYPQFLANQDDGIWAYYFATEKSASAVSSSLWLEYPATVDDSYLTGADQNITARVASTDAIVTLTSGDYSCHVYTMTPQVSFPTVETFYLVPDLGPVKLATYAPGPDDTPYLSRLWLLDYSGMSQ